jgi:hypothetical protein
VRSGGHDSPLVFELSSNDTGKQLIPCFGMRHAFLACAVRGGPDEMKEESQEQLCLAIMKELDPHRLLQPVIKLNGALQPRETHLQRVHPNSPTA